MRGATASAAVRLHSTRDPQGAAVSLDEAILAGLAPDGGLYLPASVPPLPDLEDATDLADLAVRVLAPWWGEAADEVAPLLRDALDFEVPLVPLSGETHLLMLDRGPTSSFKDVGARSMARLAGRALARRGGRATVLVATSGDTGSAVADGFAGIPRVEVALLYPRGMVSDVQERQLITARDNVQAFAVEGDFDDCQRLVKEAFRDPALASLGLTSANSINVGRLLPQMTYYLWAALQLRREQGVARPPVFVVPSGNLGNLTAGLLAERAGMAAGGFVAAHNANDFLAQFLDGRRDASAFPTTIPTLSNAMDVGAPSNFERLRSLFPERLGRHVRALSVSDQDTERSMRRTLDEHTTFVCPHTAVGLHALRTLRGEGLVGPAVVLATAHPAKFPDAVRRATGRPPPEAPGLDASKGAPTSVLPLEPDARALRDALLSRRT